MILSEKLLALRTKAGLSQEDLAEKLGVSRQSVSKWESGSSIPEIDKILRLSEIYGVSTDYLLKDEVEELPAEVVVDESKPDNVWKILLESLGIVFNAIYWMIVVAIYLAISFTRWNWATSWIIFPIAAALFALLRVILSAAKK